MSVFHFPSCLLLDLTDICLHFWTQHVSILEAFAFSAFSGLNVLGLSRLKLSRKHSSHPSAAMPPRASPTGECVRIQTSSVELDLKEICRNGELAPCQVFF